MRFIWQLQPQIVDADSWRISLRSKYAGNGAHLGCFFSRSSADGGARRSISRVSTSRSVFFQQALLPGMERPALGGELEPLEHGHLMRKLVDHDLLDARLGHQAAGQGAQLRRVEFVKHGSGVGHAPIVPKADGVNNRD